MAVSGLDKEIYFRKNKTAKCMFCEKSITPKTSFCHYARLLCNTCYKKLNKQAKKEVEKKFTNDFFK